jgi:hypothetical protein
MQINVKCDDLIHNAQKINVKGSNGIYLMMCC